MTYDKTIDDNSESIHGLIKRPLDELAVFIGGDIDVFNTLVIEVNKLDVLEEEKTTILRKLHDAAQVSGIDFEKIEQL